LVDQAVEFATGEGATLGGFVDDLDRRASEQHAPVADGVTLTTLHAAKGLEWDAVMLTGLQDGTLPISFATTPAELEEERRLLYVGMTRARRVLALSWAMARNPGGRQSRQPSQFLTGLLPAGERPRPTSSSRRRAVHCRECGQPLSTPAQKKIGRCADCPASYDEELFERLREWRKARAGEDGVPAYVVFTDATLQLIAEHKPDGEEALLRISGVGRSKLDRYGEDLLALIS
jgi:DNA helicase-2/ATP-dependent DNA helicase PcrA